MYEVPLFGNFRKAYAGTHNGVGSQFRKGCCYISQFFNFGSGSDGILTISSNTTESPIDSGCSGTSGTTSLTATNASFDTGQIILIHQSRGTGVGNWELNQIASYTTGTITTVFNLSNTYTDSGASQAQVRVLPQYSQVNIDSSYTYTAKAWDGNVGGILAFLCNGTTTVEGTITAAGKGFRGGAGGARGSGAGTSGTQGEGAAGTGTSSSSANGNGGGAGIKNSDGGAGGGGGGLSTSGSNGGTGQGTGGTGGTADGGATLVDCVFGGGGGGGSGEQNTGSTGTGGGAGGPGGGFLYIVSKQLTVTGSISGNGSVGTAGYNSGSEGSGGGGGGAGGSVFIKTRTAILGSSLVTSSGGTGGAAGGAFSGAGGAGSTGRVRVETCGLTGSTSPSASSQEGGFGFCSEAGFFQY